MGNDDTEREMSMAHVHGWHVSVVQASHIIGSPDNHILDLNGQKMKNSKTWSLGVK